MKFCCHYEDRRELNFKKTLLGNLTEESGIKLKKISFTLKYKIINSILFKSFNRGYLNPRI